MWPGRPGHVARTARTCGPDGPDMWPGQPDMWSGDMWPGCPGKNPGCPGQSPGCPGHSPVSGPHVRAVRATCPGCPGQSPGRPGWGDQNDRFWGDQNDPLTADARPALALDQPPSASAATPTQNSKGHADAASSFSASRWPLVARGSAVRPRTCARTRSSGTCGPACYCSRRLGAALEQHSFRRSAASLCNIVAGAAAARGMPRRQP